MMHRPTDHRLPSALRSHLRTDRTGAILPLFAIMLPIVILLTGFALYISWTQLLRSELRTATDFAARAGAKILSENQSTQEAIAAAIETASRNTVAGTSYQLNPSSIVFGTSEQLNGLTGRFTFQPGGARINSVRVEGKFAGDDTFSTAFGTLATISEQELGLPAIATNLDRDICLVIDRSGSMTQPVTSVDNGSLEPCGPLPSNTRFAALARAVDELVAELDATAQTEKLCLVSYSSAVSIPCNCCVTEFNPCGGISASCDGATQYVISYPEASIHTNLSTSSTAITSPIAAMLSQGIAGATAIGAGIEAGIQAVEGPGARPFAVPTIILMTDGNHNLGVDPLAAAQVALEKKIVIHTVTFSAGANQVLMQEVAALTGGKSFHADTEGQLSTAFREIARTLPVMLTQ